MKRREFLKSSCLALSGSVFFGSRCTQAKRDKTGISPGRRPPNIVFIFSDDLSYRDLSYLGQSKFSTPHIDRLARQGMVFENAYVGSPECAPSRASLMTGMHMGHCRIRRNRSVRGQDHLLPEDQTVAEVLKKAGYATCFVGKWGIGLPGTPGVPHKQGFDYSYGYYDQRRAHTYFPHYLIENGKVRPIPANYGFNMSRVYKYNRRKTDNLEGVKNTYDPQGHLVADFVSDWEHQDPRQVKYSEDLILDKALTFIRTHHSEPFFLYYATQLPHGPVIIPELGEFQNKPWSLKHKEWAAMIRRLDESVGALLDELEKHGIREDTIIFFAGDNGYSAWGYFGRRPWQDDPVFHNKGPWHKGKFICTNGGNRVPFLACWPGKIAPGRSSHVCATYDFLETAAELAKVKPEKPTDGISLVPELLGRGDQPEHRYLYWESGSRSPHAQAVLRDGFYAYRPHPDKPVQLYDETEDPGWEENIAKDRPAVVEKAKGIFKEAHTDSTWYVNPGETKARVNKKRKKAEEEGSLQESVSPNTVFPTR